MSDELTSPQRLAILERMLLIRRFEEAVIGLHQEKEFTSHYHLYIGQEATGAAVMRLLKPGDKTATTHRNHGHIIARGGDVGKAFAEILCRETGMNGGRGGTLHICDAQNDFLSTSAVVGGCIGLANGAAYALKRQNKQNVSVAFFGDGSLEEGITFEAMNIAALWSLPIIFVCENNAGGALGSSGGGYPSSEIAAEKLTGIPASLGIKSKSVDGGDVDQLNAVVGEAITACRHGAGPYFIETVTQRWPGSVPLWPELLTGATDISMAWNTDRVLGEYKDWYLHHDPVLRLSREILGYQAATVEELMELDRQIIGQITTARKFAVESPRPKPELALEGAFA